MQVVVVSSVWLLPSDVLPLEHTGAQQSPEYMLDTISSQAWIQRLTGQLSDVLLVLHPHFWREAHVRILSLSLKPLHWQGPMTKGGAFTKDQDGQRWKPHVATLFLSSEFLQFHARDMWHMCSASPMYSTTTELSDSVLTCYTRSLLKWCQVTVNDVLSY